jgi:uncharacterized damage-inducible protein DinB
MKLDDAVCGFVDLTRGISDLDLEKPWAWHSYDSEGVRFAFFRTFENLQELAVRLGRVRSNPPTEAQRILGQYHSAYRDLDAALYRIEPEFHEKPPAEEEWTLRRTLAHIVAADLGFFVRVKFALDRYREDGSGPTEIPDEVWEGIAGEDDDSYKALMESSLENLQEYHQGLHNRILTDFEDIEDKLLELPSQYWENEEMSIRFRLHRFESHMRQHTIQIDKSLVLLGIPPSETRRLTRMIFNALGNAESALIGPKDARDEMVNQTSDRIQARTDEIDKILR